MPETLPWKDPACPIKVEYSPAALENIRRLAVDGLLSLPRVGLGVGGFLLGTREAGKAVILDFHPIVCSYVNGPSFAPTLGEVEEGRTSATENAPESIRILGYYCSRPRLPVQLTEKDRTLFAYLCPGAGQIALLIRPTTTDVSRAALYYRKLGGVVAGGTDLPLEAIEVEKEFPEEEKEEAATPVQQAPEAEQIAPPEEIIPPLPLPAVPRLFGPLPVPAFATAAQRRTLPWRALVAPLLVAAILIAMFTTRELWLPRPPLDLRTAETNGHFSIEWNRAAVRGLDHAVLTVIDGTTTRPILLDGRQLQAGALPYIRKTTQFSAAMDVGRIHASATFVPPPQPPLPGDIPPDAPVPPASQSSHP